MSFPKRAALRFYLIIALVDLVISTFFRGTLLGGALPIYFFIY